MVSSIILVSLIVTQLRYPLPSASVVELRAAEVPLNPNEPSPETQADPQTEWDTAKRHQQSGEEHRRNRDLPAALEDFRAADKIMERLVALHPENSLWKRDLSVSEDKIGDVLLAQGDLAGALKNFRAALTLREFVASAEPENAEWQRNVSVSHNKIGDVYNAQGDLKAALESYLAGYGVVQGLVRNEQTRAQWQQDLAAKAGLVASFSPSETHREQSTCTEQP